jgi:hypothetical protein
VLFSEIRLTLTLRAGAGGCGRAASRAIHHDLVVEQQAETDVRAALLEGILAQTLRHLAVAHWPQYRGLAACRRIDQLNRVFLRHLEIDEVGTVDYL